MNLIHRSIWNDQTGTSVAVSENTRSAGKKISSCTSAAGGNASFSLKILAVSLMLACGAGVQAEPTGGVVAAGSATIGGTAGNMTITQTTPNVAINWQSFGIKAGESVQFVQPGSSSVALNRVIGAEPSSILGSLTANGKVFLVNPNGILFGQGASVNVGGLVASTLAINDANFMAGNYQFSGAGAGTVLNQGTINAADGGYVALLGANVSNQGVIAAQLGTVALAAGNAMTLDVAGDKLLNVTIQQGAVDALVENGGLIRADGGTVLMTTQAAGSLLSNAVNNTGIVRAQTLQNVKGTIMLMGGMENGTVNVAGTLDASAPNGSNGGFVETSAAKVNIANEVKVTTAAAQGLTGNWLIDPQDFTVGSGAMDNILGSTLSALLVTNSVTINTATGPDAIVAGTPPVTTLNTATAGNGDIHINEAISWTASPSPTTLTLNAARDVNVNAAVTATNGNFVVCCGRDVNVNEAITTTNGSVSLNAGRNVNIVKNALHPLTAISTTDGNINICAANDIVVDAAITLVRGSSIPAESLGLPLGLVLNAGYGGTGGTVTFAPAAPKAAVTGANAPVTIYYKPVSNTAPTDYLPNFTLVTSSLTQFMYVFPDGGSKTFDGTTATTLTGLKGAPAGVTLVGPGIANFDDATVGTGKTITFSGYTLGGADAGKYALPVSCCAPVVSKTTANITAAVSPLVAGISPADAPFLADQFPRPVVQPVPPAAFLPGPVPPAMVLTVAPPAAMPPMVLRVETPPAAPVIVAPDMPVVVPPAKVPETYVPPHRVPKQDRN